MRTGIQVVILASIVAASKAVFADATPTPATTPSPTKAEEALSQPRPLPDGFKDLAARRAGLLVGIAKRKEELPTLIAKLEKVRSSEEDLARANADLSESEARLKELQGERPSPGRDRDIEDTKQRIRSIQDYIGFTKRGPTADETEAQIAESRRRIAVDEQELSQVEERISQVLDVEKPRQEFKAQISLYFSFLVAAVIVGFFVVAMWDEKVRQAVFSGDAGIQFLTLFSVVIAIILFGITDILDGKELAALLGSLSGYILGRATAGTRGP